LEILEAWSGGLACDDTSRSVFGVASSATWASARSTPTVRRVAPHDVDLAYEDNTSDSHGNSNDRKVHPREFETLDLDVLSGKDIPPQQTSKRGAESRAESAVIHTKGHGVDCCPEGSIGDGDVVVSVDLLPCLDHAREKDGGADIRACELVICRNG
jgi:hypothetical protein